MVEVWTAFNYEKLKHSLNLYEDGNNILCLESRFDSLEALNHDKKILFYYEAILYLLICLFWNIMKNVVIVEIMLLWIYYVQNFW